MLHVGLYRLRRMWPAAELHVITQAPDRLRNLFPFTKPVLIERPDRRLRDIWLIPWAVYNRLPRRFRWFVGGSETKLCSFLPLRLQLAIRKLNRVVTRGLVDPRLCDDLPEFDVLVITGGGFFSDSFAWHARKILNTVRCAKSHSRPVGMFGQGFGPIGENLLRHQLDTLGQIEMITLREKVSGTSLLRSAGIHDSRIFVTGDDAIEVAYSQKREELGSCIGFNIRIADYSGVPDEYVYRLATLLDKSSAKIKARICGLPVALGSQDSDVASIGAIVCRCMAVASDGSDVSTLDNLLKYVRQCRVVITGSYHAGVFALSQGIPVIALAESRYYIDKFRGLSDMFPGGCMVLLLDSVDFESMFVENVETMWNQAPRLRESLIAAAEAQVAASQNAYRQFYELVSKKTQTNT